MTTDERSHPRTTGTTKVPGRTAFGDHPTGPPPSEHPTRGKAARGTCSSRFRTGSGPGPSTRRGAQGGRHRAEDTTIARAGTVRIRDFTWLLPGVGIRVTLTLSSRAPQDAPRESSPSTATRAHERRHHWDAIRITQKTDTGRHGLADRSNTSAGTVLWPGHLTPAPVIPLPP